MHDDFRADPFRLSLLAAPLIIHATSGSTTSTATVLVNRDAATVYAETVKATKQRAIRRS